MCLRVCAGQLFSMSEIAKEYGCTVIVSGSDSADHLEKYFQHKVDYAICGEGEITLGELIQKILPLSHAACRTGKAKTQSKLPTKEKRN